jgi:hypothetical protein
MKTLTFSHVPLLQLDFPAFLGECTRAATPRRKAVVDRAAIDAIALANFLARVDLCEAFCRVGLKI